MYKRLGMSFVKTKSAQAIPKMVTTHKISKRNSVEK